MQLQTYGPAFGEPDASPFCIKAICLLTMAGKPWTNAPNTDPRKAPYKKLPVLIDGENVVPDSDNIRYYLEEKFSVDFDESLTPTQRAQSRAWIRMVEEHLYFCQFYDRWVEDSSFEHVRKLFFSSAPPVVRNLIANRVRRLVLGGLYGQGMGRFDYDTMLGRASRDLDAIETALGDKRFLFGDTPTAADASVGAVLAAIKANLSDTGLRRAVLSRPNCVRYMESVRDTIYPV